MIAVQAFSLIFEVGALLLLWRGPAARAFFTDVRLGALAPAR